MRKAWLALGILVACHPAEPSKTAGPVAPSDAASSPAPAASAVRPLTQRYLDGLFRAKPHLATFMGDHRFDGALPDLSAAALARRQEELVGLQAELSRAPKTSLDDRIDGAILADGIALELLYLREIRDWEWDPRINDSFPNYDPREVIAGRLSDIIHGDFAPEDARRASVTAELLALPRFLSQMREALAHPSGKRRTPKVYREHAIKENLGRIEFFESEVKEFTKNDREAESARAGAVEALKKYQAFMEKELSAVADGDWRLGKELYEKKFPLALQTDRPPSQVLAAAESSFRATRAELLEVAKKLHLQLWPKEPLAAKSSPEADTAIIDKVKNELAKNHAAPDELVAAHGRNLDRMRAFIEKNDLLGLPPKETLIVSPMPMFKRGSVAAEYLAPGVLDRKPTWHATYYVDPIDPTWAKDRVESYLRGQNDYDVQLVAMHEAYPGHHTQYFYSKKNLNPLRAVLWNAAMVEGWAVYAEGLMVKLGWGEASNDRYRFYDLRGQMIACTNAILDMKLQSGQMSDEEAVRFMVKEGFQEPAMAEKKLLRAKLDSTQLVQYFLGLDEVRALENDYRTQKGAAFRQRAFNEGLIGHGSIAVKFLRRYLLEGT
ncbi:DUF885 domain-containing protein [Pendulispora albinea]|uniref:DUF885 domain-containing protein n=1 Tax=Pendulispora albinea TaxID=2741071 RepID=A0ABZ2M7Q2_9BACT